MKARVVASSTLKPSQSVVAQLKLSVQSNWDIRTIVKLPSLSLFLGSFANACRLLAKRSKRNNEQLFACSPLCLHPLQPPDNTPSKLSPPPLSLSWKGSTFEIKVSLSKLSASEYVCTTKRVIILEAFLLTNQPPATQTLTQLRQCLCLGLRKLNTAHDCHALGFFLLLFRSEEQYTKKEGEEDLTTIFSFEEIDPHFSQLNSNYISLIPTLSLSLSLLQLL